MSGNESLYAGITGLGTEEAVQTLTEQIEQELINCKVNILQSISHQSSFVLKINFFY